MPITRSTHRMQLAWASLSTATRRILTALVLFSRDRAPRSKYSERTASCPIPRLPSSTCRLGAIHPNEWGGGVGLGNARVGPGNIRVKRKFQVFIVLPELQDGSMGKMARRLRLQYPGAIYHETSRGNGRQDIVRDDDDREQLQRIEEELDRLAAGKPRLTGSALGCGSPGPNPVLPRPGRVSAPRFKPSLLDGTLIRSAPPFISGHVILI
jgi:hypothetical protein